MPPITKQEVWELVKEIGVHVLMLLPIIFFIAILQDCVG